MDSLYENIGSKIKGLAKGIFLIESIGSVISGLVFLFEEEALLALLLIFIGPLVAWISSWILYAFGQLVENSDSIAIHTARIPKPGSEHPSQAVASTTQHPTFQPVSKPVQPPVVPTPVVATADERVPQINGDDLTCPNCGTVQRSSRHVCWNCGTKFIKEEKAEQPSVTVNEDGSWVCPKCQRHNLRSRKSCWSCDYVIE